MTVPFVRQLGSQPGIQLNPTVDQTDGISLSNQDQIFAAVGRFQRGRIDKPFLVDRSTLRSRLGINEPLRISLLNETYEQVAEALANGAFQAVIYRLTTPAALIRWAVFDASAAADIAGTTWTTSDVEPTVGYTLGFKHLAAWNDGIRYEIDAIQQIDPVLLVPIPTETVTVRAYDPATNQIVMQVTGSLNPGARGEFGESAYLPDVMAAQFPDFEVAVFTGATIPVDSPSYGKNPDGSEKTSLSAVLPVFVEGTTVYTADDYDRAVTALKYTELEYGYIMSGGSRAPGLLTKLAGLAFDTNRHLKIDIPGDLTADQAVVWFRQLQIDSEFVSAFWAPMRADIPSGGKGIVGVSGLHIGYSSRRNAIRDANGFARKNYPVAGRDYPINRTGIVQLYTPSEQELSALADGQIIPVIYDRFNGGGRYVFADVLTARRVRVSNLKLTSVAEMKSELDDAVVRQAKEYQFLPITVFIERMKAYLDTLLRGAVAAGWLIPSRTLDGNAPFAFEVTRSTINPADTVLIRYFTSYDGVARRVEVTQVLTR